MQHLHDVPAAFKTNANIDSETFQRLYKESIETPETFWAEQAESTLQWEAPWTQVFSQDFENGKVEWFKDAKLNVTINTIDRHLPARAQQTAIIWEGDSPDESRFPRHPRSDQRFVPPAASHPGCRPIHESVVHIP